MRNQLLLILAVTSTCFALSPPAAKIISVPYINYQYPHASFNLTQINKLLHHEKTLHKDVILKVLTTLECTHAYEIAYNPILTIIDYSLPSSEKRLWIFNLETQQLLFHTYVSHGIKSGSEFTTFFSNRYNSKSSSIGVYRTEAAYRGREGLSLKLEGLEKGFNDNAMNRSIVMHGGWYMAEDFIQKYGRAGRSWGCPAVPIQLSESIINTIKDNTLIIVYYPDDTWFSESKYLNCHQVSLLNHHTQKTQNTLPPDELREEVLFANAKIKRAETDPVVVISANDYTQIFQKTPPLNRMLRRQIDHLEYIALSSDELKILGNQNLQAIHFVVPNIKMVRGYYITEMLMVNLGTIKNIEIKAPSYTVYFNEKPPLSLRTSNQFIRWLGL